MAWPVSGAGPDTGMVRVAAEALAASAATGFT